jgi:nucleoid-associated protein YgaU
VDATITANSRYANNTLVMIKGSDGRNRTTITSTNAKGTQFSYTTHVVTGFDRLDTLAYTYLGDPSLWWQIANINPDVTIDWSVLPIGAILRIPVQ